MADAIILHHKLKRLKPDTQIDPDVLFVAILKHEKLPTDELNETDALWIKCPKTKLVAALRKAYTKSYPMTDPLILLHDMKAVQDTTTVQTLNVRHDDLIVLEAIPQSQLAIRMFGHRQTPGGSVRKPLRMIIHQLNGQDDLSSKPASNGKEKTPDLATTARNTPNPASASAKSIYQISRLESAWYDFACEWRELLQRDKIRDSQASVEEMDNAIKGEWARLVDHEREFLAVRAERVSEVVGAFTVAHRGFWTRYYDELLAQQHSGQNFHKGFELSQEFFKVMLNSWSKISYHHISAFAERNRSFLIQYPIPRMPEMGFNGLREQTPQQGVRPALPDAENRLEKSSLPKSEDSKSCQRIIKAESDEQLDTRPASPIPCQEDPTVISIEQAESNKLRARRLNILERFTKSTPEQLEKGVQEGIRILANLRTTLEARQGEETTQWLQSIASVEKQAVRNKTIVGVVGATGAGKSSVINAMMDEERLVPTNCMRACTAVVTEISYNHDDEIPYKAEIEFITREDWRKELKTLFQDLFDGNCTISRESTNEDSEAGIAYAKLKAVYPKMTREDLQHTTIDKLMAHDNVSCLGTQRDLQDEDSLKFYKKLQSFVDSKEKAGAKNSANDKDKKGKRKPREMEFWPLIRVVRLLVKASALSTGAVIVDLPGVHDSNQARAAVAQGYLKQCTGLWIVAPITRAVDDKSAKSLLGESFKRQLKMDGGYNSVTFICSKTDDISLIEAQDSLGLEDELGGLWEKKDKLENQKKDLVKELKNLKDARADFSGAMEDADEELELWEKLKEELENGAVVYRPEDKQASKKRKRSTERQIKRKKSKYSDSDDDFLDDDSDSSNNSDEETAVSVDQDQREPLSDPEISTRIAELRDAKKNGRRERSRLDDNIKTIRGQMDAIDKECEIIDAELSAKCISGRNEYTREAIRHDFAAGIRELDQELAEEEDAANFNPDVDVRDYDEVGRGLPVFCVSSRGYQKLMGRLQKDPDVPGFNHIDETEIPKLQAHCKKLTEAGREASCRRFLNSLSQILNSLRLWSSNDGTGRGLTEVQQKKESEVLQQKLRKLDSDLDAAVKSLTARVSTEIEDSIYESFPAATAAAMTQAVETARQWGAPVNREDRAAGGLYWATYKAVVRREGVFTNAGGLHNFNEQLTEPIIKHVAGGWEKAFSRRIPSVLNGLPVSTSHIITEFHNQVEARALRNGASMTAFHMLKHQLPVYKETIKDAAIAARNDMTARQKDINREFVPEVTASMLSVYDDCNSESGPGQYMRMKGMMLRHVEGVKDCMFEQSVQVVASSLKKLVNEAEDSLLTKIDEIFMSIQRDYVAAIIGRSAANTTQQLPREQRLMRKTILDSVDRTEVVFKRVVGLEADGVGDTDDEEHAVEKSEDLKYDLDGPRFGDAAFKQSEQSKYDLGRNPKTPTPGETAKDGPASLKATTSKVSGDNEPASAKISSTAMGVKADAEASSSLSGSKSSGEDSEPASFESESASPDSDTKMGNSESDSDVGTYSD